jgi:predicted NBD/HSP70 family sugar kinase
MTRGGQVYVGVDWGGTKIEVIGLTGDGEVLARVRADTPALGL